MSGLETSVFAALALMALLLESRRSNLTPAILAIATLLRPEGSLVFLIVFIHRIARERRFPLILSTLYFLPVIPFMTFRFLYYGSLLPNTFYAKSGIGIEYITKRRGIFHSLLDDCRRLWCYYCVANPDGQITLETVLITLCIYYCLYLLYNWSRRRCIKSLSILNANTACPIFSICSINH